MRESWQRRALGSRGSVAHLCSLDFRSPLCVRCSGAGAVEESLRGGPLWGLSFWCLVGHVANLLEFLLLYLVFLFATERSLSPTPMVRPTDVPQHVTWKE